MQSIKKTFLFFVLILFPAVIYARESYRFSGSTYSTALGRNETLDSLILNVSDAGQEKDVSLSGYQMFGFKGMGIRAKLVTDPAGNIVDFRDVVITGIKGSRVITTDGTLTADKADITISGKVGIFGFRIQYVGHRLCP